MSKSKDSPLVEQEVVATSAVLMSAAFYLGQFCKKENDDFMKCKQQDKNPAACVEQGLKVTRCSIDLYDYEARVYRRQQSY